jgi:two-component system NtrC family sensor kinase
VKCPGEERAFFLNQIPDSLDTSSWRPDFLKRKDHSTMNTHIKNVCIVDDDPLTVRILHKHFSKWGYAIEEHTDPQAALARITSSTPPFLVILDWMMPELNGIEICKEVKKKENGRFCYILMLTSKSNSEDLVTALDAGAHDFLSKPVNPKVLRSKVEVAERLLQHELELEVERRYWNLHADQMEDLANERARQLTHSDRMASIGVMAAGIAHEINNPTSFISGNIQTFERFWPDLEQLLQSDLAQEEGNAEKHQFILEEVPSLIDGIKSGVHRISKIVKGLKSFVHQREPVHANCNIAELVDESIHLTNNVLKRISVQNEICSEVPMVRADGQKIQQVLINLMVNAAHAMEKSQKATLILTAEPKDKFVELHIQDSGPGIPEEMLDKIWMPFFTTKEVGKGTGLGLHICRDIMEEHGGTIDATNTPGGGACFTMRIPISYSADQNIPQTEEGHS